MDLLLHSEMIFFLKRTIIRLRFWFLGGVMSTEKKARKTCMVVGHVLDVNDVLSCTVETNTYI